MSSEIFQAGMRQAAVQNNSASESRPSQPGFKETFGNLFEETAQALQQADETVLKGNTGGDVSLHEMMIDLEKADTSLRLLVQVRNKTVDAYKEIMRMQV
ncbi:MAG: flagellar hook-basal body complex protein FliE [Desulfohalobiaceae bacterium]|nr:flagellar hook-basal body complex protein FliE [Desulfohalobiaceae bacterium]